MRTFLQERKRAAKFHNCNNTTWHNLILSTIKSILGCCYRDFRIGCPIENRVERIFVPTSLFIFICTSLSYNWLTCKELNSSTKSSSTKLEARVLAPSYRDNDFITRDENQALISALYIELICKEWHKGYLKMDLHRREKNNHLAAVEEKGKIQISKYRREMRKTWYTLDDSSTASIFHQIYVPPILLR